MTPIRTELQQRAQRTILYYALFRWESAVVLAMTGLLTFFLRKPFPGWPSFAWPLLGAIGLILLIYASITDRESNAKLLVDLLQSQFLPEKLHDSSLRQSIDRALDYQRQIELHIRRQRSDLLRQRLESTATQIGDWVSHIYQLGLRLDTYRADTTLTRQRLTLPQEVTTLQKQRQVEEHPVLQKQLDELIVGKNNHWQTLCDLDDRMKQASLQIEQSLTALATVYSQVQLIDAQSIHSGRAERLQSDIREQVERLNDLVSSITDVYTYR